MVIGTFVLCKITGTHTHRNTTNMSCVHNFSTVLYSCWCLGSSLCQSTQFVMSMLLLPIIFSYPGALVTYDFCPKIQIWWKSPLWFNSKTSYHNKKLHIPGQCSYNDMCNISRVAQYSCWCLGSSLCQCTQFVMSVLLLPITVSYPGAHVTCDVCVKIQICRKSHLLSNPRLCFYQTRSAWSMDQGSNRKHSAVHNFAPTVTKFCVMWEGQALPHDTKFSNCRCEIVGRRVIFIWSLIPGSSWSGLIKAELGLHSTTKLCTFLGNAAVMTSAKYGYDNVIIILSAMSLRFLLWVIYC